MLLTIVTTFPVAIASNMT